MIEDEALRRWRMHTHFADGPDGVAALARRAAGLQAQDASAVRRQLAARGVAEPERAGAAYAAGEVVSSWLMRGTLHLVPAADARWLTGVFGPRVVAGGARRRRELGLDEPLLERALAVLPELLETPATRAGLVAGLRERGVPVEPDGQAPHHLMAYAAAHGVLCRGSEEPTYRPLPAGRSPEPEDALAELARWHAGAFGPVGPEDFAGWSGLGLTAARRAFAAAGLVEVAPGLSVLPGAQPPPEGPPLERLLGPYDCFLLGYRDRRLMLDEAHAKRINAGGGVIRPAVVRDGLVVGTWRPEGGPGTVERWA
ncbi:winged helix DNA-binding domain-containing protein [Kitasatospora sp. NPDC048365]|uniref:winged helix DNA-binding domain-containing protein n=1 Tax=Kitasatospora sp. NPDC048365 TaxID=3364050 RepID=UPI00371049F4